MKKISLFLLLAISFTACKNKKDIPDVSGIKVDIAIQRFDQNFFSIDTNNIPAGLKRVQQQHPDFYTDFMQEILGVNGIDTNINTVLVTKEFLRGYLPIYDSLQLLYKKTDRIQKDLTKAFQFVNYYYPKYKTGNVILFIGPFDAPGVASTDEGLAIGLQQYAGKDFRYINQDQDKNFFPYISHVVFHRNI